MSAEFVIRGRALVDGAFLDAEVHVIDGTIAAIGRPVAGGPASDRGAATSTRTVVELAADEVLIPGLVDTHVHVNEPGRTEWEGFASATRAAAAGGVTTLIDMPLNSIPPTTTPENLAVKRAAASGAARVDVGFWGGAVPENLGRLRELHDAGVFGFKCFLAPSGVDEFGHLDAAQLDAALHELAAFDGQLLVHAEDPGVLHAHENGGGPGYADFVASRPPEAELVAIRHVIDGVRRTGTRAHILHLSSAAALPELRAARAEGLPITVETCPHYLAFSTATIPDAATQYKCAPPIRDEANRDALWRALLDGDIDLIVTDHSPSTAELKFAGDGDFGRAWGGIAGLQLGLSAVWTAAAERGIPLELVLGWMSEGPARFARLPGRGVIAPGARADLAVFAPDERRTVHAAELLHKNPVSAFDGAELRGTVRRTWLAGHPVDLASDAAPAGTLLTRP
ncbi:allantoinase AllB [Lysinimonas soli]|uniref:allantoinase n=1 Tax=Lysinimonas soli TaxID=1074233 RepID=A0ABW0NRT5_9MICO